MFLLSADISKRVEWELSSFYLTLPNDNNRKNLEPFAMSIEDDKNSACLLGGAKVEESGAIETRELKTRFQIQVFANISVPTPIEGEELYAQLVDLFSGFCPTDIINVESYELYI